MQRVSRDRLYYQLISDIQFERKLSHGLPNDKLYQIVERICSVVCSESTMVVAASMEGFNQVVPGKFGKDEPWPDWANKLDLMAEGLVKDASGSGSPQSEDADAPSLRPVSYNP